jgi:CubicO group peptidase (beta-lactamase class C family)
VPTEIIGTARKRPSVFTVNDRSTYSNVAFSLLGMVLEKATGKSYFGAISESILQPLGMNNTRATKPKDSEGIIPHGANDWTTELGSDTP